MARLLAVGRACALPAMALMLLAMALSIVGTTAAAMLIRQEFDADCSPSGGAGCAAPQPALSPRPCRERYGSRSGEHAGEPGEDRQVGVEPDPLACGALR